MLKIILLKGNKEISVLDTEVAVLAKMFLVSALAFIQNKNNDFKLICNEFVFEDGYFVSEGVKIAENDMYAWIDAYLKGDKKDGEQFRADH